ncbi:hypothetical protein HX045_16060 [Myroides odoratimimus]|uniref:hypothetical protein n=3 Tax=Myroides odoratimimus TaxID=76832 RepID=UPI00103F31A5|nr:hypothetical protein [Myroides odoratimimus]MCO7723724.1 hypothetical protein [Myroides odoratimimus]MDM1060221.1 hypothetical protein [Myroides odoratimimus]MDM1066457.1 hypothetical protein [Myroides odoratimimus]MDM1094883.1 hypothetical protein [Myroides odoratimimus]MDM1097773.1 hypothetical protein [Myroides odoratimimus]
MLFLYIRRMQKNCQKEFSPLYSKDNVLLTWVFNISGGALLVSLFILLALLPLLVSTQIKTLVIIGLFYYPIWAIVLYRFYRYIKSKMAVAIRNIKIDDQGIHFSKKDGSTAEILYDQLGHSYRSEYYDVYLVPINKTWRLAVGIDGVQTEVVFDGADVGSVYQIKNARALRAKFIEGIVRFRPDLKIDPSVFKEFSIHPQDFTFDGKRYMKHIGQGVLIISGILVVSVLLGLLIIKLS